MNCPKCGKKMSYLDEGYEEIGVSLVEPEVVTERYVLYCSRCRKKRYFRKEYRLVKTEFVETAEDLFR